MTDIIVDAYTHCGLSKYKPIESVREVMEKAGVSYAVLVQHLDEFDNSYIGNIASDDPEHFAGVCQVNSTSPSALNDLNKLSSSGIFKGVRFAADTLITSPELWQAAIDLNMIIVLYAPDGIVKHVESLAASLGMNPSCQLVLTHMGNPDTKEAPDFIDYKSVFRLAQYNNIYYQISGMKMFCSYPHEIFYPLIKEAHKNFGVSRLIWGSNYPVVGNKEDYKKDLNLVLEGQLPIPKNEISQVIGANSVKLWFRR